MGRLLDGVGVSLSTVTGGSTQLRLEYIEDLFNLLY